MTGDDHAALVALGKKMATTNGYTAMQSSSLYVTDGDEIDWAYGIEHIFMYTFELYPSHSQVSSTARFYPPDEVIGPQTERNREAILHAHRGGRLPVRLTGKAKTNCGAAVRRLRDVRRLDPQPARDRHRHRRRLAARRTRPTTTRQAGTTPSGSRALVTGDQAGSDGDAPTTSTAASRRSARRRSPSRRRSAR